MTKKKIDIIKSLAINAKDVGSAEVQIGLLSEKIEKLALHFKKFKKDKHSTTGLSKSVNKRKKLLGLCLLFFSCYPEGAKPNNLFENLNSPTHRWYPSQ